MTMKQVINSPTQYPVSIEGTNGGAKDRRYAVRLEYCGYEKPRHVLRFCGVWAGAYLDLSAATLAALGHKAALTRAGIITETRKEN